MSRTLLTAALALVILVSAAPPVGAGEGPDESARLPAAEGADGTGSGAAGQAPPEGGEASAAAGEAAPAAGEAAPALAREGARDDFEGMPLPGGAGPGEGAAAFGGAGVNYWDMLKVAGWLLLVVGLVLGSAWTIKRFMPRTSAMFSSEYLKILARTYVGTRQAICLVKVPGKLLVVGSTQQSLRTLAEIDDPAEVERVLGELESRSPQSATRSFRELLSGVTGGGESRDRLSEAELAAALESVSDRVARLNSRLEDEPGS